MKLKENAGAYVWGAAVGAIALAIIGFNWGGWVTGGTATKEAASASHDAVVSALAPICAARFKTQDDAAGKTAELAKAGTWDRGTMVTKSGFALMPGGKDADPDVARACAEMLVNPATPKT
jgi:hypothetical protein